MLLLWLQTIRMTSGAAEIYSLVMKTWFRVSDATEGYNAATNDVCTYVAAIRDDYNWWHSHSESDTSGKLLLIDCETHPRVVQLFFDDNIERDRPHIVDVRTLPSFAAVPFEQSRGLYLRRVEPYAAILDDQYYVNIAKDVLRDVRLS